MLTQPKQFDFPVELQPAFTSNGRRIKDKQAIVRTDTGDALSVVSDRYQLIPHGEVVGQVQPLLELLAAQSGGGVETKWDLGKNGSVLNYIATYKGGEQNLKVGDRVGLRVIVRNSYTGNSPVQIRIGGIVLSCLNGMVREDKYGTTNIRVAHTKGSKKLEVPAAHQIFHTFDQGVSLWDRYSKIPLIASGSKPTPQYQAAVVGLAKAHVTTMRQEEDYTNRKPPETAWDFLQDLTYDLTHRRPRMSTDSRINLLGHVDRIFEEVFA